MDNHTLYRSPVRLISHSGETIGEFSPQTISRAKKKLLAFISLSDNEMDLNGLVYTKNDIISLLDSITDETAWQYHCAVYAHPALLAYLEEAYFDDKELSKVFYQTFPEGFFPFISQWFANAFNQVSGFFIRLNVVPQKAGLRNNPMPTLEPGDQFKVHTEVEDVDQFAVLAALMDYQRFIQPEHQFSAFERIRVYFHDLQYTLRNLSWEKFREDESVLHFVFTSSWMDFANKLPASFAATRDELVGLVIDIVIRFQKKATWYYLEQVCLNLQNLECSEGHQTEIKRLTNHFSQNVKIEDNRFTGSNGTFSSSSTSGPSPWRVVFWCIWIILTILRLGACN